MQNPWRAMAVLISLAVAGALHSESYSMLASLLLVLLTFVMTDRWHRRRRRANETLYRQLLRQLPIRLRIRTPEGRLLLDNRPYEQSVMELQKDLPLSREEPPDSLSPLSRRAWQGLRTVLSTGVRHETSIELSASEQGKALAYRQIFFPIVDTAERITALGSLLIDQSDLNASARALQMLTNDLENQVRERTWQLARAKESAERQAELQTEFMAHLSHEIRSPLSALVGLAHLASRSSRDSRLNDYLEKLRKAAEHLLDIVNDVLDFSRLDAGQLPIARVPFSPGELVWNVVDMIGESAREKGLAIGVELDSEAPTSLLGDPLRISQILINLASNAVKFTRHGRIDFRMRLLSSDEDTCRLRFEVEDSGPGIPADSVHLLFKPFSQLAAPGERQTGTGLGLAISARLAGLMGGQLNVHSEPGEGSLFFLELELARQTGAHPSEAPTPTREREPRRIAGQTVLVVDDDPLMREVSAELLHVLGLRVHLAADGLEALECLRREPSIALVCMDLQMPHLDGLETTRALRRTWPDLPVIAITGSTRDADRHACREAGMNDFLPKPVALPQLEAVLRRWLPELAEPIASARQALPLPDIPGLDQAAALERMLSNQALYLKMLRRFLDDNPALLEQLQALVEAGRLGDAAEQLHRFKSLAATLGAVELQARSARLEAVLQAGGEFSTELAAFEAEYRRLYPALREALAAV